MNFKRKLFIDFVDNTRIFILFLIKINIMTGGLRVLFLAVVALNDSKASQFLRLQSRINKL
ncbi:hypothetical protein Glaag_4243 [Glaciecola sp. 4H-3-7+YE-5]|jgi:hypothetical protein|nr:hypothetical protein Glaag_4243 [Glaciecola sp. 4H-3-7+YE-5]